MNDLKEIVKELEGESKSLDITATYTINNAKERKTNNILIRISNKDKQSFKDKCKQEGKSITEKIAEYIKKVISE